MMNTLRKYFIYLLIVPFLYSCSSIKEVTYFNTLTDQEILYKAQTLEPIIQKNDLLSISVTSINTEANQLFNLYTIQSSPGLTNAGTAVQVAGYLVDQSGNIQFPILGTLHIIGMTKKDVKDLITNGLVSKNVLYDPVVNVRYLNYRVTVLGEVAHPSVYNVPGEKVTLLEALGLAGDLTLYAQRDNILIIREVEEGKRISKRINLNTNELLTSPYYYLQSNDIVYVTPSKKANVASVSATKVWLPTALGLLSFSAVMFSIFYKN